MTYLTSSNLLSNCCVLFKTRGRLSKSLGRLLGRHQYFLYLKRLHLTVLMIGIFLKIFLPLPVASRAAPHRTRGQLPSPSTPLVSPGIFPHVRVRLNRRPRRLPSVGSPVRRPPSKARHPSNRNPLPPWLILAASALLIPSGTTTNAIFPGPLRRALSIIYM